MNKDDVKKALAVLKANAKKRKFSQKIDLIVNFKELDLKKPEQQVDLFVQLPKPRAKKSKICAFVGPELAEQAKNAMDTVVLHDQFIQYAQNPKLIKKLASAHDFFVAQANIMPDVAKTFGRILGPRNKMPNPKAGCVVPPNANLAPVADKLRSTVRVLARTQLSFKTIVGDEQTSEDDIADNILAIYSALAHHLPLEDNNIKTVLLKYTMSAPVAIGKEEKP
ncbi:50S ribosomal protein L1 [Candidatus Woesearchaeota archaeon]|nr:50S ribosomal protein L1 [Candidatus Woesearchaeota archaeon]